MYCRTCHHENSEDSTFCARCGARLLSGRNESPAATRTLLETSVGLSIGSTFAGKYRIVKEIGRGGMGVVFKAEDATLKRCVALKFMPNELGLDLEARARFIREAQAAAVLSHPNICTIHEVGEEDGRSFIAMEFIEGQNLRERTVKGALEIEEAVETSIQIAEGLEEAHKRGIVHRDIKSANVMISEKGLVKIMDFGIAKIEGAPLITKEAKTIGTAAYMSPEQVRGEAVDARTDIWSFGVVLFEMFSGVLPFKENSETSLMYSIVHEEARSLKAVRPDVPAEIERIINRALIKEPDSRYRSAAEMLNDLRRYQDILKSEKRGIFNIRSFLRRIRQPRYAVPTALIIIGTGIAAILYLDKLKNLTWARKEAIPEINRLKEERDYLAAFQLAQKVETFLPDDRMLGQLWPQISAEITWGSDPAGARISIREIQETGGAWIYLGQLRGQRTRVPLGDYQVKLEKEGYETVMRLGYPPVEQGRLYRPGELPARMTKVPGGDQFVELNLYNYERLLTFYLGDFLIDKYEVTNREFREFVDKGGYRTRDYWKHDFVKDGTRLPWDEAMTVFCDKTGRPGPSTWAFGTYPEGQDDYPVSGVSWYEAEAFAEYASKRLPTVYHWDRAAHLGFCGGLIVPQSNFGGEGPAPVGSYSGSLGYYGTLDMTGNVREWCANTTGDMRFTLGGAWEDPPYFAVEPNEKLPFDRSPGNGFRCIRLLDEGSTSEAVEAPIPRIPAVNWDKERPFSDEVFSTWASLVAYPELSLNPVIGFIDETPAYWKVEKVTFDAAYEDERVQAYLFLPKNSPPPYQTVIWWPGAYAGFQVDSQNGNFTDVSWWDYFVKDGRAVLYPILKGTYERGGAAGAKLDQMVRLVLFERNMNIKQIKDIRRSIDYLNSREDIDSDKLAYCGFSWGAHMGSFVCSMEPRIKTGLFVSGSLFNREVFGFAPRVKIPILMINGRYDSTFPYEACQQPLFNALGTAAGEKSHKVYPTDHMLSGYLGEMIKANLEWLDRYLGPLELRH